MVEWEVWLSSLLSSGAHMNPNTFDTNRPTKIPQDERVFQCNP